MWAGDASASQMWVKEACWKKKNSETHPKQLLLQRRTKQLKKIETPKKDQKTKINKWQTLEKHKENSIYNNKKQI